MDNSEQTPLLTEHHGNDVEGHGANSGNAEQLEGGDGVSVIRASEHDGEGEANEMASSASSGLEYQLQEDGSVMLFLALVFLTITWTAIFINEPLTLSWFAFHPPLQSLAIILFTLGVLQLQPTSLRDPAGKARGLARHQLLNLFLAVPSIIAGATFIIINKSSHGAAHFTTWHSIFGLISLIWLSGQIIVGAGSVWFDGALFGGGEKAKRVYKYHRLSGYLLLLFLWFTAYLAGSWSTWFLLHTGVVARIIGYAVSPLAVIIALFARVHASKMPWSA